jgi:hypothetical protein
MVHKLTTPVVEEEASTKDIVIEILSEEFPLSIRKIYNIITKNYRKRASYHAVYKAVYELLEDKVLVKKRFEYALNKDYIARLSNFVGKVKLNYLREKGLPKELAQHDFAIEILHSQYDMAMFILDFLQSARKGEIITIIWPVVWPSFTTPEIYSKVQEIGRRGKAYCVCSANGFLDKHFAKYWRKMGMKVRLGVKLDSMFEIFILRDMLLLIYQPPDKRVRKHKYIDVVRGISAKQRDKIFLKAIKEKTEIFAFIVKDPTLANKMKQDILAYF